MTSTCASAEAEMKETYTMPLDPYNLTPNASINRVVFMSAPGLPEAWQCKTAFQVIGRDSLLQRINAAFPELAALPDPIPAFNEQYLAQEHPSALKIADEMGRALGCLLLIVKLGEAANRAARDQWDDSYWTHWSSIQHVILGGGLMAGLLGKYMRAKAAAMLNGLMSLAIATYPAALPLIGTARMATEANESAWVFDFGGTNIKRAYAIYINRELVKLEQLPSIFIPVFDDVNSLFDFMIQAIVSTISTSTAKETIFINASIANYVHNCHLAPDTPYSRLRVLGEDLCQLFSKAVGQQLSHPINMTFVHDGTAAAKTYAGATATAVITIGTALGVGFPPPQQSLRPLSENFSITFIT